MFFTTGDSREPELAGIYGALWGSAYLMLVTLRAVRAHRRCGGALPRGVRAAGTALTDLIEVNVNNLAAVPSIVFGLLGLAVFLNVARPAPLLAPGRRHDPGAAGAADDRGRHPRGAARGAALDPRRPPSASAPPSCRP